MDLTKLFVSQRKLRAPAQVRALVESVRHHEPIPPILLSEDDDGTVQVEDGHHRVTAYWLAGRERLEPYEYILIPRARRRPRFGGVADLLARVGLVFDAPVGRERLSRAGHVRRLFHRGVIPKSALLVRESLRVDLTPHFRAPPVVVKWPG